MNESPASPPSRSGTLPLVIGLGNEHRGDDRSGLEVARALRARLAGRARIEECTAGGIALLDLWRGVDRVLVVDAVRSGAPPGTVHRLEPSDASLLHLDSATSTHGFSLADALALAQGLDALPKHLVVYGIEAQDLRVGDELTPQVARGVEEATARILAELEARLPAPSGGTSHA
jgi:hydrogenase maturation protease